LSLAAAPATIAFGQTTTLSGTLHGPSGPHASVTLQSSGSLGGPFVTVTTMTADAHGAFSFPAQAPSSTTVYRALANGTTSAPVRVGVRFRVRCLVSNRFPRHGTLIRFHGRVAPAHNGFRVQIQRLGSGRVWHTIASARLHRALGNASTYSIKLKARTGTYRATVKPDAHHWRGSSAGIKITTH
jgi:hypothetical protein